MGSCRPTFFVLFLFIFQVARAVDPSTNLSCNLTSSVDLKTGLPKGANFTVLTLHSLSRKKVVALLQANTPLQILDLHYSKRVTFVKETGAFRIHNLSLADGGTYDIYRQTSDSSTETLKTYTLFVFDINITATSLANRSCSLDLLCQAGVGTRASRERYTWKKTASGETLSQEPRLRLVMHPENSRDSYTCTAQDGVSQGAWDIIPYPQCSHSGATGHLLSGLPRLSCLLSAGLVALVVLL
uniref:CD48 antigen-like n=1 Tax=Pogona vitticeps TaxID=103695 RepID=A0ABM5F3R0_9SAUR